MRVLNKKYWPVQIKMGSVDVHTDARVVWCDQHIDKNSWRAFTEYYNTEVFVFAREDDAVAFKLRWA